MSLVENGDDYVPKAPSLTRKDLEVMIVELQTQVKNLTKQNAELNCENRELEMQLRRAKANPELMRDVLRVKGKTDPIPGATET